MNAEFRLINLAYLERVTEGDRALQRELGGPVSRIELIQRILHEMEQAFENIDSREMYEEWRSRSVTMGRRVCVTSPSGEMRVCT